MRRERPFSPSTVAGLAGLVMMFGAGCGSTGSGGGGAGGTTSGGSGGTSSGGVTGSGGRIGTGETTGTGGSTPVGTGGDIGTGGRMGTGGSAAGGAIPGTGGRGSGGVPGTGGATSAPDAAVRDASPRDGRSGSEVGRDTAVDAAASQQDVAGPETGCVPDYACTPAAPNTGDPYADCVARVNQFRACVCLPPLARWTGGEACADQDAKYDSEQNTAHAGAQADICDWGNAQDECPDWKRATPASVIDGCLQMMFDEGPPPSGSCTGQCYSDHGHYINMTGTNYKSGVACGFYTTSSGSVWSTQNFK